MNVSIRLFSPVVTRERVSPLRQVLVLVGEQGAGDVRRVAAALDVDQQRRVVHRLVLQTVEPGQVDPVFGGNLVNPGSVLPRLQGIDYPNLEEVGIIEQLIALVYISQFIHI